MTSKRWESEVPPAQRWSDPEPVRPGGSQHAVAIVLLVFVGLVVLVGFVLFAAGEDLLGSDPGSIDAYNREVLDTCDVPANSTLVRTYVLPVIDGSGVQLRTMSHIYASSLPAQDVASFYHLADAGIWADAPPERACRFGNRPSILVLSLWTSDQGTGLDPATETVGVPSDLDDEFWAGEGADVTDIADPPKDTRSFLRLRLGQRERQGVFE